MIADRIYKKSRARLDVSENYVTETDIARLRQPLAYISNINVNINRSNSELNEFSDHIPFDVDDDGGDDNEPSDLHSPKIQPRKLLTYCVEVIF